MLRQGSGQRLLRRLGIDFRPGEGATAALLFTCFFLILTFQVATKSIRQSTFIDSLGAGSLPLAYFLVALSSFPFLLLYTRVSDRLPVRRLIVLSQLAVAAGLGIFWWLYGFSWPWLPAAFYVGISIVYVMAVSQFWSLANRNFDPRQAKRLFGFVGAGGLLGGILGGQLARLATGWVGTRNTLLVAAVLPLAVAVLVRWGRSLEPPRELPPARRRPGEEVEEARGGAGVIRRSRHLQLVAALMLLSVIVARVVDLQFNWAVERATTTLDQRTAFFGNFYSVVGIAAFLFQILFAARIHRSGGVGVALRVFPATLAVGTAALLASAALFPGAVVAVALLLKIGENGLHHSLDQTSRELLFLPVPQRARFKAKAFIDVFLQPAGKGLGALLLLPVAFGVLTAVQAGWISLALIAVWLGAVGLAHREYIRAFREGLRERTATGPLPIDLTEGPTLELLMKALGSPDSRQVLNALDLLAAHGRGGLVNPLLLYHDDPAVRRRTLEVLAEVGRTDVAALIEKRIRDEDPDVRAEAIRALAGFRGEDVCHMMLLRLRESDAGMRAAAVACLANHGDPEMVARAAGALADMLSDADPEVRVEAAKAIGAVGEPQFHQQLIRLLYDAEPQVVREAIGAVRRRVARDGFSPLYVPSLVALLSRRRLKHDAREALVAFGEPAIPALVHFMNDPDEQIWVRRALPKTVARMGGRGAAAALASSLSGAADPHLRRNLIQALAFLREGGGALPVEAGKLEAEVREEARRFLACMADLWGLEVARKGSFEGSLLRWDGEVEPTLLDRLLAEKMESHLHNLFGLLALIYRPEDVGAAHRSLLGGDRSLRSRTLEYLDNSLAGDVRRWVFAVIDDAPPLQKLDLAARLFGVSVGSKADTLGRILGEGFGAGEATPARVAALYAVHTERVAELRRRVAHLAAEETDPFVRGTAAWVADRLRAMAAK